MNDDLKGRALRAAAAVLAEVGPLDSFDRTRAHDKTVAALAAAWLDGYKAGTSDVLSMLSETEPLELVRATDGTGPFTRSDA